MALAIFDLDNTLLGTDSDHQWGEYLCDQGLVSADEFRAQNDQFYEDYKLARLDINAYLRFVLTTIKGLSTQDVDDLHSVFFQSHIAPFMLQKAQACVDLHKTQGDTCLVITATSRFITEPIVKAFGIEHIIASEAQIIDGRYTGEPSGTPSFADGKVERLAEWLKTKPELKSQEYYFYSDSRNDLPLLEQVSHPIAVDPDDTLRQIATERGWPIVSFRD
jgi:HAD superfamily hydrolase (TIGR01490 family)